MSRQLFTATKHQHRGEPRRGVILLVVLALLTLFTLLGLTLVLATAQARLSALSSAKAKRAGTPPQQLLSRAFLDVARGCTDKRSPIQAHGFLEDLYGAPVFIGQVTSATMLAGGTTGGGQLLQISYSALTTPPSISPPYLAPNASYVYSGLLVTMRDGTAQNRTARIVADRSLVDFAGGYQLITTAFGGAGASDGGQFLPKAGDTFVINGRPFSGTGAGFQLASYTTGNPMYGGVPTYALDAVDPTPYFNYLYPTLGPTAALTALTPQFLWPYALLPNNAQFTSQNPLNLTLGIPNYTTGGGWYTDPGGPGVMTYNPTAMTYTVSPGSGAAPGGVNEPWDAVDFQNMFLAMHYFDSNELPRTFLTSPTGAPPATGAPWPLTLTHPATLTPVPSFHRPELIAYWSQQLPATPTTPGGTGSPNLATTTGPNAPLYALCQELRRKILLRPNPEDHGFIPFGPGDLNNNGVYDFREPFTDVNGNGYWDTPGGVPEPFLDLNGDTIYTPGDLDFTGKRFNPITGPYCIYHDPTTTLDMWVLENPNPAFPGPTGSWDVDNDNDGYTDSIWMDVGYDAEPGPDGRLYKPLFAILCVDMDGKLNLNAHGNTAHLDATRYTGSVNGPFTEGSSAASGTLTAMNGASRNFTFGEGVGPAEINLLPVLQRFHTDPTVAVPTTTIVPPNYPLQYYQQLLQGTYIAANGAQQAQYVNGRFGEVDDPFLSLAPTAGAASPAGIISGPQAGRTYQFDPLTTFVNDPLNQFRQFLDRPYLLLPPAGQPPLSLNNSLPIFFDFIYPNFQIPTYNHVPTGSSNAYNLYGRGAPLLDLRGQLYYAGSAFLPWNAAVIYPNNNLPINDTVDDPYEIDLSLSPQQSGMIVTAAGNVSQIDSPFKPEELERVLRASDVDAQALSSRLDDLIPVNLPLPLQPEHLSLSRPERRHAVTTDSFDLPAPGVTAVDSQQIADQVAAGGGLGYQAAVYNTAPTTLGGKSIVDMARARIMARNGWTTAQADLALFGSMMMGLGSTYTPQVQPLLAPELVEGMRIDINRAVGNGIDDNANGAVDEPAEVIAPTEAINFPLPFGGNVAISLDLNNDGLYPTTGTPTSDPNFFSDARARQLLARHLYVTMMLLIDDLGLQAQVFRTGPSATPVYSALTTSGNGTTKPAQQLAYFVAQWAINVVDFRDADSIMTPFEFDMSPFTDDDSNPANGTWDVDDVVYPVTSGIDPWTGQSIAGYTDSDDSNPLSATWRGLVFGCERPELLISETIAIHDRGTADTNQATNLGGGPDTYVNVPGPPTDTTYDQVRRPRGSIIVELLNPNSPLSAPQGDMLQGTGTVVTTNTGGQNYSLPNTGGVNLTQFATNPANGTISPVWRLATIYSPAGYDAYAGGAAGMPPLDPRVPTIPPAYIHRVAYFTPYNPASLNLGVTEVPPARSFFPDPTLVVSPVVVQPNSYALVAPGVVDPRPTTAMPGVAAIYFGARNSANDNTAGPNGKQNLYHNYLELNPIGPNAVGMYNNFGVGAAGGVGASVAPFTATLPQQFIKNVVALPLATLYLNGGAATLLSGATPASTSVRFSLSEPEAGYPQMPALNGTATATQNPSTWDDGFYYLTGGSAPAQYPNTPFDMGGNGVMPNPNVSPDGTIVNYTTIYLQRLANPMAPWDAVANPYITVDSMPLDLTSYTGENLNKPAMSVTPTEPPYGTAVATVGPMAFDARSRGRLIGGFGTSAGASDAPNIWTTTSTSPVSWSTQSGTGGPSTGGNAAVPLLFSTFGYLNQTYWMSSSNTTTGNVANAPPASPINWYAGFYSSVCTDANAISRLNAAGTQVNYNGVNMQQSQYYGDPILPFPWLVWNNRPFISQYELMLVPASSPSMLVGDFGLLSYAHTSYYNTSTNQTTDVWTPYPSSGGYSPYNPVAGVNPINPATGTAYTPNLAIPLGPFQQLLNFYDSTITNAAVNTTRTDASVLPGNFFRIFEYLNVPSPYTGTQKLLNPAAMSGVVSGLHWLHPPFNLQSQYRDPGRINLNTVFDPAVLQGLLDDYPMWQYGSGLPNTSWQNLWQGLVDTRRGYNAANYNPVTGTGIAQPPGVTASTLLPNLTLFGSAGLGKFPTYFANPFRPEGAGVLEPPIRNGVYPTLTMQQLAAAGQTINTTMLRSTALPGSGAVANPAYPGVETTGITPVPLFAATTFDQPNNGQAGVAATYASNTGTAPWRQAGRNAYFQYQAQQRLGNLVTNRSNVFAVWVTVGYFEAIPVLPSAANPDGFQLGPEKGSDTGEIERHRSFYMFDRSIPMGFQRGEDLNVQDGILVERMIE